MFFSLPCFGKQSQKLKRELTELLTSYFSDFKLNIVLINNNTIGNFFPYKDGLPLRMRSSIVYEWCCPRDCGSGYVGSTSRNLLNRASEHAGVSCRTRRPLASPPFSNIREHAEVCGAPVNISDFSIIFNKLILYGNAYRRKIDFSIKYFVKYIFYNKYLNFRTRT